MLRFIIRRQMHDRYCGATTDGLETVDIDVPELERLLLSGGRGQEDYDLRSLAGVEVLPTAPRPPSDLLLLAAADLESWMKSHNQDAATEDLVKRLREAALGVGVLDGGTFPHQTPMDSTGPGR